APPAPGAPPPAGPPVAAPPGPPLEEMDREELWEDIGKALKEQGLELDDYELEGLDRGLTREELEHLLAELRDGRVDVTFTGPEPGGPPPVYVLVPDVRPMPVPVVADALPEEEAWEEVREALKEQGLGFDEYEIADIEPPMTAGELEELLAELRKGNVEVALTTPEPGSSPVIYPLAPGLPVAVAAPPEPPDELTEEEAWEGVKEVLEEQGLGFDEYEIAGIEPPLTAGELEELLAELRKGNVEVALTTPEPGAEPVVYALAPPPPVLEAPPAKGPESRLEWSGFTDPVSKLVTEVKVYTPKQFRRLWRQISDRKVPDVDFRTFMVVGVIAGSGDGAEQVEIQKIHETQEGLVVRYRLVVRGAPGGKREAARGKAPYRLRVIPATELAVEFKRIGRKTP
ncbi:MAG: hypothetical protein ABII00_19315, partial [Elusimicrobiota bacterium]